MNPAAAILRDVYGKNAAQAIAFEFNVAVITAKKWLAGRFPESRTGELKAAVQIKLDRIDARNAEIRKTLGLTEDSGAVETRDQASRGAAVGAAVPMGAAAERPGGKINRDMTL